MFKSTLVGIGYVATGLAAFVALRFIIDSNISPAIAAGIMAAMVISASQHAYKMGKKDGASDAQKVEQDRTTEGEES